MKKTNSKRLSNLVILFFMLGYIFNSYLPKFLANIFSIIRGSNASIDFMALGGVFLMTCFAVVLWKEWGKLERMLDGLIDSSNNDSV